MATRACYKLYCHILRNDITVQINASCHKLLEHTNQISALENGIVFNIMNKHIYHKHFNCIFKCNIHITKNPQFNISASTSTRFEHKHRNRANFVCNYIAFVEQNKV